MDKESYNVFHEGAKMNECSDCGAFLEDTGICPNCY